MPKVYGFLWCLCYILVQFPPYSRLQDWNVSQMHSNVAGKINTLAGCTLESWLATCSVSTAMSAPKRCGFLSPTQISLLVWDSERDLATKQIYCCGTVWPNSKGMPQDLGPKRMTLQRGDLQVRIRGDLTAILWRDNSEVYVLTNIHDPPAEGNFCDNNGKAIKSQIVVDYNRHMGYVDKGYRMTETYSINRRIWKWTKKLLFHLFDLAILNSYILFSSLGGKKISLRDFRMILMRNSVAQAGQEWNVQRPVGGPAPAAATQSIQFEERGRQHWPIPSATWRCHMCLARGVTRKVTMICQRCGVGLCCNSTCFQDYQN